MEKLIMKVLPLPKVTTIPVMEDFVQRIEGMEESARLKAVAALSEILLKFEQDNSGTIQYKIVTPADIKSARAFYSAKVKKQIPLMLTVEKWRKKHTKKQRGILHAIIDDIGQETGMDKDLVKDGIKQQYGVKVEWKGVRFPKRSRDMTTVEYGMLIDGAIVEAGELGIDVRSHKHEWEEYKKNNPPPPDEGVYGSFRNIEMD